MYTKFDHYIKENAANLKKYKFNFMGRKAGAIGISYKISTSYNAESLRDAVKKLYTDYQHVRFLKAQEGGKEIPIEDIRNLDLS